MTMADRIAVMEAGRLQQVGAPRDVYARPANLFVARFIGSPPMNTVDGRVRTDGGHTHVEIGDGHLDVGPRPGVAAGAHVVVGIRPEHLHIADPGVAALLLAVASLPPSRPFYSSSARPPSLSPSHRSCHTCFPPC